MLLNLLPDEALDSFISRNYVYSQRWYDSSVYKFIASRSVGHWTFPKLEALVEMLGLHGAYGYNYLIHNHTNYYRLAFVQRDLNISYGPGKFKAELIKEISGVEAVKLCPACLNYDYLKFGFIYWKRSHQVYDIEICSQHNVKLVSACGGCSRPFHAKRHFMEAPWSICDCGFKIFDLKPQKNHDIPELNFSKFIAELYNYEYQLNLDEVIRLVRRRLNLLGLFNQKIMLNKFSKSMNPLHYRVFAWNVQEVLKGGECFEWGLVYILAAIFYDFNHFATTVLEENVERRHIHNKWGGYGNISAWSTHAAPFYSSYMNPVPPKLSSGYKKIN